MAQHACPITPILALFSHAVWEAAAEMGCDESIPVKRRKPLLGSGKRSTALRDMLGGLCKSRLPENGNTATENPMDQTKTSNPAWNRKNGTIHMNLPLCIAPTLLRLLLILRPFLNARKLAKLRSKKKQQVSTFQLRKRQP